MGIWNTDDNELFEAKLILTLFLLLLTLIAKTIYVTMETIMKSQKQ